MPTKSKQSEAQKIPKLRFSGFSGGWVEEKLGDVAEITSSKRVYLSDYVSAGIPFFRGKEISELKKSKTASDILYIKESKFREFKNKFGAPQKGDILITSVGTLGNIYKVDLDYEFYFKDGNLIWLKNPTVDSSFLEMSIDFNRKNLLKCVIGSTQKALTIVEVKKVKIPFPSFPEQQKIAGFLGAVDEWIENLRSQKQSFESYKKGMMQKIFSQEIRFKDDDGNDFPWWEEKRLEEVVNCLDNKRKPLNSSQRLKMQGNIPYYGANGVLDYLNDYIFEDNLVLLAEDGGNFDEFHNKPIAQKISGKTWVNNHAHVLKAKNEYIYTDFLFLSLVHKDIRRYIVGGGRAKLNRKDLLSIRLAVPAILEQQKIVDFLTSIDNMIESKQQQITQAETWKKGLMQGLFV